MSVPLSDLLRRIDAGENAAAEELLPLVYRELRTLAAAKLAHERPGHTLQATALVHEAYLRLLGNGTQPGLWDSQRHFFAAAAEAMRRILVESARRKQRLKHGGTFDRADVELAEIEAPIASDDLVALDDALTRLATIDAQAAEVVKLRYFAGMTTVEAAEALAISPRTADRAWAYAKAWLYRELA